MSVDVRDVMGQAKSYAKNNCLDLAKDITFLKKEGYYPQDSKIHELRRILSQVDSHSSLSLAQSVFDEVLLEKYLSLADPGFR